MKERANREGAVETPLRTVNKKRAIKKEGCSDAEETPGECC